MLGACAELLGRSGREGERHMWWSSEGASCASMPVVAAAAFSEP